MKLMKLFSYICLILLSANINTAIATGVNQELLSGKVILVDDNNIDYVVTDKDKPVILFVLNDGTFTTCGVRCSNNEAQTVEINRVAEKYSDQAIIAVALRSKIPRRRTYYGNEFEVTEPRGQNYTEKFTQSIQMFSHKWRVINKRSKDYLGRFVGDFDKEIDAHIENHVSKKTMSSNMFTKYVLLLTDQIINTPPNGFTSNQKINYSTNPDITMELLSRRVTLLNDLTINDFIENNDKLVVLFLFDDIDPNGLHNATVRDISLINEIAEKFPNMVDVAITFTSLIPNQRAQYMDINEAPKQATVHSFNKMIKKRQGIVSIESIMVLKEYVEHENRRRIEQ